MRKSNIINTEQSFIWKELIITIRFIRVNIDNKWFRTKNKRIKKP